MNTTKLNQIPDFKGTKGGQTSVSQLQAACIRENANEGATKKTIYLQPNMDAKIDDFFKYQKQTFSRMFDIEMLESAVIAKYANDFGVIFARELFYDCLSFSANFTKDIVTKVEANDETAENISYVQAGNTITRYLVSVDEPNVCSVFRHFVEYAKATNRPSVALIQEKEEAERAKIRAQKASERKEAKETAKVGTKIAEMDVTKLMSLLTPEQLAAIIAAQSAK
jgi:hypothetical protein